jgi:membrane-bound ClpP family serine protease
MRPSSTSVRRTGARDSQPERRDGALRTYIGASLPGWLVSGVIAWLLYGRGELPLWGAAVIVGALIVTDFALFPRQRRYYSSEPAGKSMIGAPAVAASDLAPRGFVRVHGELWQAEAIRAEQTIREGDPIRVREIRGLRLIVDRWDAISPNPPVSS